MFVVHVRTDLHPKTENAGIAKLGFSKLGCHIMGFQTEEDLRYQLRLGDCVVGHISDVIFALDHMDVERPANVDYPQELAAFYGRKIWQDKLSVVANNPDSWPVFCKSINQKGFDGRVVNSLADLNGCGYQDYDRDVFCSETIDIVSEWRGFIRYGKLIDVRGYKGRWDIYPDPQVMREACEAWTDKPAGCCIDFGVTSDGRTVVIECNDGFAMGCYGLNAMTYAKLMSARWHQLIGKPDPFMYLK